MAIPVVAFAIFLAIVKPEPGILLVLAFDVVFAGVRCPADPGPFLVKGQYARSVGCHHPGFHPAGVYLFYTIPEALAGLDTMIPPVVSLVVMVVVSLMTQKSHPPKHHVITEVPDDVDVLAGRA